MSKQSISFNPAMVLEESRLGSLSALDDEDSGYGSAESGNSSPDNNNTSTTDEATSDTGTDALDDTSDSDDDSMNLEESIAYLSEKRHLLKRAFSIMAQEDNYDASQARHVVNRPLPDVHKDSSSIWVQAQGILRELNQNPGEADLVSSIVTPDTTCYSSSSSSSGDNSCPKNNPNPRDPAIDLTCVQRVTSDRFEQTESVRQQRKQDKTLSFGATLPSPMFGNGQWMAHALVNSASPAQQEQQDTKEETPPQDYSWKMVADPVTCSMGLVPPSTMSMENAVDIGEALAFTKEPRVVTQSTPPFCIVHVNRAFLVLGGLFNQDSLIGHPIESMIHVVGDARTLQTTAGEEAPDSYMDSVLPQASNKTCRIRVVPILDRSSKKSFISNHSYSCMSHVLIRVQEAVNATPKAAIDSGAHAAVLEPIILRTEAVVTG